jgi:hypothetical protein
MRSSLTGLLVMVLLLTSLQAQAQSLVMWQPAAHGPRVDQPDASSVRRWASSADYRWEPDVDRAIDHVFEPPSGVSLAVTQTREDVRDGFEPSYKPNSTLGAVELKIHW